MSKLHQAFKNIPQLEPTPQVETAILSQINTMKMAQVKRKLMLSYFGLAGSMAGAAVIIITIGRSLMASDFWKIASLIFSDTQAVISYDFALSLLETLPAFTLAVMLVPIFTFLLSIGSYLDLSNNQRKYI